MFNSTSFFFSWFVVLAVFGASLYVADRRRGTKVYRWFYDMTHKTPLERSIHRGFIFGRSSQSRFRLAVLIASLQSLLAIAFGASSVAEEILTVIVEVPCLLAGFTAGPFLYRLWERREAVFETVDRMERGEVSLSEKVKELSQSAFASFTKAGSPAEEAREAVEAANGTAQAEVEDEVDPRKYISRYVGRH